MSKRIPVTPSIISYIRIPNSKVTHCAKDDCRYCIKDKHGRSTGMFVKNIEEKTCRKCDGTGKLLKNKNCTRCKKGIYIWRSPLIECRECQGSGHKDGPSSLIQAFDNAKKALPK